MSDTVFYFILFVIFILAVVLTYIFSKLKFDKTVSTLEERITSMANEKEEKDQDLGLMDQKIEGLRAEIQNVACRHSE